MSYRLRELEVKRLRKYLVRINLYIYIHMTLISTKMFLFSVPGESLSDTLNP